MILQTQNLGRTVNREGTEKETDKEAEFLRPSIVNYNQREKREEFV